MPKPRGARAGPTSGCALCVTGVLSRKREEVHELLRGAGATIHDGVKKGTTYLVAGDKTGKTKLDQAKKFGTKVVTEAEMDALVARLAEGEDTEGAANIDVPFVEAE